MHFVLLKMDFFFLVTAAIVTAKCKTEHSGIHTVIWAFLVNEEQKLI